MGFVYVFTNIDYKDSVKIGITINIEKRRKELSKETGVRSPFQLYYAIESKQYKEIENLVKIAYAKVREPRKEHYYVEPEEARALLKLTNEKEVPADSEIDYYKENPKSKKIIFKHFGIPTKAKLTFIRNPKIQCTVKTEDDNIVLYRGKEYTLSKLADKLMRELGINWKYYQGPAFFEYEGVLISRIIKSKKQQRQLKQPMLFENMN